MLFWIIFFIVTLSLFITLHLKWCVNFDWSRDYCSVKDVVAGVSYIISGIVSIVIIIPLIVGVKALITTNIDREVEKVNRDKLVRMLEENYNPDNLKNAIEFNASQKRSEMYNSSLMWYCWENCYVLDTIQIPTEKYIPSNYVKLEAVIEQLSKSIEK